MKEKHAVVIAGITLNLLTEEPRENLDALASALDGKIRELMLHNKRINKTETAMFCALEYYSEKSKLTAQIRKLEAQAAHQNASVNYLKQENERLMKKCGEENHPQSSSAGESES